MYIYVYICIFTYYVISKTNCWFRKFSSLLHSTTLGSLRPSLCWAMVLLGHWAAKGRIDSEHWEETAASVEAATHG